MFEFEHYNVWTLLWSTRNDRRMAQTLLRALGEELRERRKRLRLSQEALAEEAGLHRNVIGRLERGTYNPSLLTLLSIAVRLGARVSDLIASAERRR
jgi:transcriptional regulator with XRE-family HTH domain